MNSGSEYSAAHSNKLLWQLIAFEVCLVAIFTAETLAGSPSATLHRLFDLNGEGTIPAWFSSVQLFSIGLVFLSKRQRLPDTERAMRRLLAIAGAGFIFLSADEAAAFHEKITVMLTHVSWVPRFSGNHGIWVFVYGAIGVCLAGMLFRSLMAIWRNARPVALMIAVGFAVMLIGGVGFEILGYEYPPRSLMYQIESAVEEFLEMAGASIMLCGSLRLAPEKLADVSESVVVRQDELPA